VREPTVRIFDCTGIHAGAARRGAALAPSTGEESMGNPFVHVELMSTDVDKAKSFFGKPPRRSRSAARS
jgi:hypothetical protein